jgi:hypothetical protein
VDQSARVTSIEALQEFKAALHVFCEEAKDALCAIEMQTRKVQDWLLRDQTSYWKHAVRDRQEDLAQAKADLFRKQLDRITGNIPDCIEEKKAVRRAQERLKEADDKIRKCQEWARLLPRAQGEYQGPARQLEFMVEGDPPASVILLNRIIASLDAYVELAPPVVGDQPAATGEQPAALGSPAPSPPASQPLGPHE